MGGPVDERTDGLLPVEALVDVVAFKVVAAGEAQELRMHRRHLLHQVDAEAVGAIVISGREKRDELHPERAGVTGGDHEVIRCRGLELRRFSA